MKIKKIVSRNRRDFEAVYECESCGANVQSYGHDDRNFHDNVIPNMSCPACKESSISLGTPASHTPTRYAEWEIV